MRPATAREVITSGTSTSYASNADNEITQVGSAIYTYDANGNLHTGYRQHRHDDLHLQRLESVGFDRARRTAASTFQYSPLGSLVGERRWHARPAFLVDPTGLGNVAASD